MFMTYFFPEFQEAYNLKIKTCDSTKLKETRLNPNTTK